MSEWLLVLISWVHTPVGVHSICVAMCALGLQLSAYLYRFVVIYHWGQKPCLLHLDFSTAECCMWHIRGAQACWKEWIRLGQMNILWCIATMWVYLHISGEVFPELQSFVYLSEWVRKDNSSEKVWQRRASWARSKRQQVTGGDCLSGAHPVLCGLSQNKAPCFPFLLALFKFSRTVRTLLFRNQLRVISSALWRRMRNWFHASNRSVFLPWFRLSKFCFLKGRQNGDWNNWFNNNLEACKMPSLLLTREDHISQVDTFLYFREEEKEYHFPPS